MRAAIVINLAAPYRVDLFNAMSRELAVRFSNSNAKLLVLYASVGHPQRRRWLDQSARSEFEFEYLPSRTFEFRGGAVDFAVGVTKRLENFGPDVVVVAGWDQPASWEARRWARIRGIPFAVWSESAATTGSRRGPLTAALRRRFVRGAGLILVPGVAADHFAHELAPDVATARIPNSVEDNVVAISPSSPRRGGLFIGELSERKGVDLLLKAIPILVNTLGNVTIAGHGPLEPAVAKMASSHNAVRFLGNIDAERRLEVLSSHSVLLLPSRRDPWPLVAVEALTMGMPVVLGPGVASAPDLWAMAGEAVASMNENSSEELVSAAQAVRDVVVPEQARCAFRSESAARMFVDALLRLAG